MTFIREDAHGFVPMPDGDIILTTGPLGGLGDHLIYSTLPERFARLGRRVCVDRDNSARSDDILDMVWARNPHIIGSSDRKPNAGYCRQGLFYEIANRYPLGSLEAMERAHGLPPPYSIAPKLYYKPKPFHLDLSQTVLIDFSAISSKIGDQGIYDAVRAMKGRFRNAPFLQVIFPTDVIADRARVNGPSYEVDGLQEYCDLLAACRAWVGSEAGGQALAAAVRGEHDVYDVLARPEIVSTMCPATFNSRGYTFRGVDYRVTGTSNVPGDYFWPHEVERHVYELRCQISIAEQRAKRRQAPEPERNTA